ncbi:MAG: STAS domain-containing protein [Solirubrobacteraceae bacterium]
MDAADSTGLSVDVHRPATGVVVVELTGEIDMFVAPDVRATLDPLLTGEHAICVDLSGVPFVDSTALAVLLRARRELRDRGGGFVLAGARAPVASALDQTGLGTLLRRFPAVEDAIAALREEDDANATPTS